MKLFVKTDATTARSTGTPSTTPAIWIILLLDNNQNKLSMPVNGVSEADPTGPSISSRAAAENECMFRMLRCLRSRATQPQPRNSSAQRWLTLSHYTNHQAELSDHKAGGVRMRVLAGGRGEGIRSRLCTIKRASRPIPLYPQSLTLTGHRR